MRPSRSDLATRGHNAIRIDTEGYHPNDPCLIPVQLSFYCLQPSRVGGRGTTCGHPAANNSPPGIDRGSWLAVRSQTRPNTGGMTNAHPGQLRPRPAAHTAASPCDEWSWWWEHARTIAHQITHGIAPPVVDIWGPVLEPDEVAVMTAEVTYSRFYGGDGHYERTATYVLGRPALMIGALAATAAINHRRKATARRDAVPSWRDAQHAPIIVTTKRVLAATDAGWESAWWSTIGEFQPDLPSWTLTLGFGPGYAPMRLQGPAAPALSIWAAAGVLGRQWRADPRLTPLLS